MKVELRQAFGHPVLRPESDDFMPDQIFDVKILEVVASQDGKSKISLKYELVLTANSIRERIESNQALLYLDFRCSNTLFQKTLKVVIENDSSSIRGGVELPEEEINGNLSVVGVVVAAEPIENYSPTNIHPEFQTDSFALAKGNLMALTDRTSIPVDFDRRKKNSFIRIQESELIPTNAYEISAEDNQISLLLGKNMFEHYRKSKGNSVKFPYLFLGLYKDCLVAALEIMSSNPAEEFRWMETLSEKIDSMGLAIGEDLPFSELNVVALQLLGSRGVERILKESND